MKIYHSSSWIRNWLYMDYSNLNPWERKYPIWITECLISRIVKIVQWKPPNPDSQYLSLTEWNSSTCTGPQSWPDIRELITGSIESFQEVHGNRGRTIWLRNWFPEFRLSNGSGRLQELLYYDVRARPSIVGAAGAESRVQEFLLFRQVYESSRKESRPIYGRCSVSNEDTWHQCVVPIYG